VVLARRPGRPVPCIYIFAVPLVMCTKHSCFVLYECAHKQERYGSNHFESVGLEIVKKESRVLDGNGKKDHEILCYTTYNTHKALKSDYYFRVQGCAIVLFLIAKMLLFVGGRLLRPSCTFTQDDTRVLSTYGSGASLYIVPINITLEGMN
jgi:hypothetical protein